MYKKEVELLRSEVQELSKNLKDCTVKLLTKEREIKDIKSNIEEKNRIGQQNQDMERKFSDLRLQIAELKVENQDLIDKNRNLQIRNEELKVEGEMEKVGEMDRKIEALISKLQTTNA